MPTIDKKYLHSEITGKILQGFYQVANKVGYGFGLEIFKNALAIEFAHIGLKYELDKFEKIEYRGEKISQKHELKLYNQLKNSSIEVGLLLNIYIESNHKRLFYSNDLKQKN